MDPHIKEKMNTRIKQVLKESSGPSFQERVAVRAAKLQKETKVIEDVQLKTIEAAMARAKTRPTESPCRKKDKTPPSIEEMGKEQARIRRETEALYAKEQAASKLRMDTREPLFRLSEVNSAFEQQHQRQLEHRRQLKEEESRRWDHLQELQMSVLDRPLLMEDPAGGSAPKAANDSGKEELSKDPKWKEKFNAKMHRKIEQTIKDRSGQSFEERVKVRSAMLRRETREIEETQANIIDVARSRAKARPCESPFRPQDQYPPSVEDWGKVNKQIRQDNEADYAQKDDERRQRMNAREPLFRVSEVEAAVEMQEKRRTDYQRQIRKEEQDRWAMLNSMQERVIDRPLLVESYERPIHSKTETELRLIPDHTKPSHKEQNIKKCVSQPWFHESAWGKEVAALKQRMDARPKLSEISYPPKVLKTKPAPQRIRTDLDKRLEEQMTKSWYKSCQWASEVDAIKQRQNDRPKLHEIAYPEKKSKE